MKVYNKRQRFFRVLSCISSYFITVIRYASLSQTESERNPLMHCRKACLIIRCSRMDLIRATMWLNCGALTSTLLVRLACRSLVMAAVVSWMSMVKMMAIFIVVACLDKRFDEIQWLRDVLIYGSRKCLQRHIGLREAPSAQKCWPVNCGTILWSHRTESFGLRLVRLR